MSTRQYTVLILIFAVNIFNYQVSKRYKNEIIELKEELSIGVLDGPEEYIFNRPGDIDVDSKGNIYVADRGDNLIKVYNQDGKFLKTIGRQGQGPGEFGHINKILIDKNDILYTTDARLRRLSIFDIEGNYKNSYSFAAMEKFPTDFFVVDDGNFILLQNVRSSDLKEGRQFKEINLYSENMEFISTIFG